MRALTILALFILNSSTLLSQVSRSLKGSRISLARQNTIATSCDLSRIPDSFALRRMIRRGYLIRVPDSGIGYRLDRSIGGNLPNDDLFRYARPWVKRFLASEGRRFAGAFPGMQFKVTSLVRTEQYQNFLIRNRHNPNAVRGQTPSTLSPHLTGSTLDISKKNLTLEQVRWLRTRLIELKRLNRIIAVEERRTNSFHVFVIPPCSRAQK